MQLLTYTDYALRILLHLGNNGDGPVSAPSIAAAHGISVDHIAKAAKALTRQGLLHSTRGVGGGVQLAVPARDIVIGRVVRRFEAERGPVECLRGGGSLCVIEPTCRLKHAFHRAEQAFYAELDGLTLADLLADGPPANPAPRLKSKRRRKAA